MDRKRRSVLLSAGALLVGIACGVGVSQLDVGTSPPEQRVLGEHRAALDGGTPTRQLGEDCTQYGWSACLSGLCLHARTDRNGGYFCSRPCVRQSDCPIGWRCPQIYPGPQGHFCVPPAGWDGGVGQRYDGGR